MAEELVKEEVVGKVRERERESRYKRISGRRLVSYCNKALMPVLLTRIAQK
jgi:hypothetical protein